MNYEFFGSGQKIIVFLHGWGGSTASFRWLAETLCDEFKVLLVDFDGFGKSKEPLSAMNVSSYASGLKNLLFELQIKECFVVAHSFGGRVALKLNLIFDGIAKVVLVDSAGLKPKFSLKRWCKIKQYKMLKFFVKLGILKAKILQKFGSKDYKVLSPIMKQTFINVVNEDLSKIAKQLKKETLIVWGEADKETPIYMAKRFKKLIKNSEMIVLPGCGHFSYLEEPVMFRNILLAFFKE